MNNVFVVILNWNKPDLTIECLKAVQRLNIDNYNLKVVVVDNGSTDKSEEKIDNFIKYRPEYKLLVNKTNTGFAGGNNVGINYALRNNADYIMILNNDTLTDKDLIINLLKTFRDRPDAGAVSPKIYFAKGFEFHKNRYKESELGKIIWYAGGVVDWNNIYGKSRGVDELDSGQYDERLITEYATGTCMMVKRNAFSKIGLFNEKYFMYYEDTDLSMRMKKNGFNIYYEPGAIIWHKVAQSSGIGSELNDYFISRNRMIFGLRYGNLRAKLSLIKESLKLLIIGRKWQKIGIKDFYLRKFGRGSWNEE